MNDLTEEELAIVERFGIHSEHEAAQLRVRVETIRQLHVEEMFGDCVEDGQRYPCRTICALDLPVVVS